MNLPPYSDALQRSDLKRYPTEIDNIPNRGAAAATAPQRESSFSEIVAEVEAEQTIQAAAPSQRFSAKTFALWQNAEFGFGDFLDIVNPLQHIPIVATVYRNMTGDSIGAAPRVIGGALWGRLGGFISGIVNAVVDWLTGKDIGDHIYAALFGDPSDSTKETAVAQAGEGTLSPPLAPAAAPEDVAGPLQASAEPVSEVDHVKEPLQSSNNREVPPRSSVSPALLPDAIGHALLSSYLRRRKDENSDANLPRLYVKV